jgi:hypothetical protein
VSQADQQPLSFYLFQSSQEKGSYTSGLFDLAEDRLHTLLAFQVGLPTRFRLELAEHSVHHGRVLRYTTSWRYWRWVAVLDAIPGNKGFDEIVSQGFHFFFNEIPGISQNSVGNLTQVVFNLIHHGHQLLLVVGLLRDIRRHDHLRFTIHRGLAVVRLHKRLGSSIEHDATLRIGKIPLVLVLRNSDARGGRTRFATRRWIAVTVELPLLYRFLAGLLFKGLFGLSDLCKAGLFEPEFLGKLIAPFAFALLLVFLFVESGCLRKKSVHFGCKLRLPLLHASITHSFVLGGIGLDFSPVQGHVAELHEPRLLANLQHLNKPPGNLEQMTLPEIGNPPVIRMRVAREDPEGHIFIGLLLYAPGTADSHAVSVKEEFDHHEGMIGRVPAFKMKIFSDYFSKIQRIDHIAYEQRKVIVRQPRAYIRRK